MIPSAKTIDCVKVAVRCRPISSTEIKEAYQSIVTVDSNFGEIAIKNPKADPSEPVKQFTYDFTYGPDSTQEQVYLDTGYPIVQNVIEGYNGTIFAYGQTGTGKTFTMEGLENSDDLRGIIPRSFDQIFYSINQNPSAEFLIRASFLEIYMEEVHDLLSKDYNAKLEIKENPESGFYVKNLNFFAVKSVEEIKNLMNTGRVNRHTAETDMNDKSSRSHSIFSIILERSEIEKHGEKHYRVGKLNLVDLAGSERQDKTHSSGIILQQALNINKSLLTLGNVISSLADGNPHIPYRDSKLTKLLRDSLGGNTKTVMIANIGPADFNYDETISTLRYANRAKNILNKPKINEDPKDTLLREYQEEIAKLKSILKIHEADRQIECREVVEVENIVYIEDQEKIKELEAKLEREKLEIEQNAQEEIQRWEAQKLLTEEEKAKLIQALKQKEKIKCKEKKYRQTLLKKLKKIQEQVCVSNQYIEQAEVQEQELQKAKQEVEKRRRQEMLLERQLKDKDEINKKIVEESKTLRSELDIKTAKLQKLVNKYQSTTNDLRDMKQEIQWEKEKIMNNILILTQQLKLKSTLIESLVPEEESEKIENRAVWNEDENDWILRPLDAISMQISSKRPQSSVGLKQPTSEYSRIARGLADENPRFRNENILKLDLDFPERTTEDWNWSVSDRLRNIISGILYDIDSDSAFIPIESYSFAAENRVLSGI